MRTPMNFPRYSAFGAPLLMIALLAVGCTSDGDADTVNDPANTTTDAVGATPGTSGTTSGNADYSGGNAAGDGVTTASGVDPLYPGERTTPATPAEERSMARGDMRGLRSLLVADLEAVRARLNVGTMPEAQQKRDQDLAAELAQGLERVDRALAAMDASTDATWAQMREVQMNEVSEVRAWMIGYRSKTATRV